MESTLKYFFALKPAEQVKFLREGKYQGYADLGKSAKIEFIKTLLKSDLSSKTTASALKVLRRLGYNDRYFYRKFLYHIDTSVALAARKAVKECSIQKDSTEIRVVKMFQEGKSEDRVLLIRHFIKGEGKLSESLIASLLSIDDQNMREALVTGITPEHKLDDNKLVEAIKGGAVWYARAALVSILGNRKSRRLFDIVDSLLNDRNVEVRLALIDALKKFEGGEGEVYLERMTGDPLVWVRKKAQKALTQVNEFPPPISPLNHRLNND